MRQVILLAILAIAFAKKIAYPEPNYDLLERYQPTEVDRVTALPQWEGELPVMYSGYVEVNQEYGANLFYYFIESQGNPATDPLVLWLQGGPGCSSLFGAFVENGPILINATGSLYPNPWSWNANANLIYVDQPAGTGYSYVDNSDGYVTDENTMAVELYTLLTAFLQMHPKYAKLPFYVFGESYAGKYIPSLSHYILTQNQGNAPFKFNLQAIGMGDGWVDPYIQTGSYAEYLYGQGLIGEVSYDSAVAAYQLYKLLVDTGAYELADTAGNSILQALVEAAGGVDVYDIRYTTDPTDIIGDALSDYLNQPSVMAALHANSTWQECADGPYFGLLDDVEQSVANLLPDLLANYQVLNYNGNKDLICNFVGTNEWTANIEWPGQNAYNTAQNITWSVAGQVAGTWKYGGNLTHIIVNNAGHMAPFDQPQNTQYMLYNFIAGKFGKK